MVGVLFFGSSLKAEDFERQQRSGYFEGKLDYVLSYYSKKTGKVLERESFSLVANKNRLALPSIIGDLLVSNMMPPGVDSALIRNDKGDIVLYGKGYDAYYLKGFDLTLLGMVFKGLALADVPMNLPEPEFLGSFKLRNKRTELWRYTSKDGFRLDMYFCDDYRMNWGVLSKSWLFGSGGLRIARLDELLSGGRLPVRIDIYENGRRFNSLNLMQIHELDVPEDKLRIPHPKVLNSATRLLYEMVSN